MLSKTIESYGGPFQDAEAVANPETEQSADQGNRVLEDGAQLTRTGAKAFLSFTTTVTAAPVAATLVDSVSQWGEGASVEPTVEKTGTGVYVATYATEYDDALVGTVADAVAETEQVSFRFATWNIRGATPGVCTVTLADNVVTVRIFNMSAALSDLSGGVRVDVWLR